MAKPRYDDLYVGDTAGQLEYQMLFGGVALDVTGAAVVVEITHRDTGAVIQAAGAGVVVTGLQGLLGYTRVAGDVAAAAPVIVKWTVTLPGGAVHKSPDIHLAILDNP